MKNTFSLAALAALLWLLPACTAQESYQNAKSCAEVEIGMSQEQVRRIMGEPTGRDTTAAPGQTWSYLFGSATDTSPIRIEFGDDGRVKAKQCAPQASGSERPTGN
ncbi:Beta-barrel assembly machine subunit BamE [Hymenobacter roseosalivarius DSM 11622]|uniref:Beta-barrel assembly machine subunit BamE n=1 Tax=Hymenobacter roseosalivarius DSM 11622 TaxID=645990 RepID=A0A1W1VEQ6_9BACT|nr:outer membrane protein assembly factor BamE [Hymenobacter roseosalivarius]SMB91828.1 Beta-barrel assembly machine subunit BamE [Hymenobacter roseosalivarius DSM 11622]